MTQRQELDDHLVTVVDRYVTANPTLAADFGAVFGAGASDTAAQWLTYYLTLYTGHIDALTASVAAPVTTPDLDAAAVSEPAAPLDPADVELLADIRTTVDEAVAAVPEAALLSSAEIDQILMDVLAQDVE